MNFITGGRSINNPLVATMIFFTLHYKVRSVERVPVLSQVRLFLYRNKQQNCVASSRRDYPPSDSIIFFVTPQFGKLRTTIRLPDSELFEGYLHCSVIE